MANAASKLSVREITASPSSLFIVSAMKSWKVLLYRVFDSSLDCKIGHGVWWGQVGWTDSCGLIQQSSPSILFCQRPLWALRSFSMDCVYCSTNDVPLLTYPVWPQKALEFRWYTGQILFLQVFEPCDFDTDDNPDSPWFSVHDKTTAFQCGVNTFNGP